VSEWQGYVRNAIRWQFVTAAILYVSLIAAFTVVETGRRLRRQERLTAQAEAQRVVAELHALRAQLNPHFLFNTLHSITALVRAEPRTAEEALERLAACLRHVLDVHREGAEEVALGDELSFVRDYLALERMRFGDRVIVTEEIDPDLLDAPVLSFLLQPLVENSVRHGLTPIARAVHIRLRASYRNGRLELEVADDGAGCDQSRAGSSAGIGLRALRQRLATRYGADASLEVSTAPGKGFRTLISFPLVAPSRLSTVPASL
jgi:LytS/YehU family sensor histidine kinase